MSEQEPRSEAENNIQLAGDYMRILKRVHAIKDWSPTVGEIDEVDAIIDKINQTQPQYINVSALRRMVFERPSFFKNPLSEDRVITSTKYMYGVDFAYHALNWDWPKHQMKIDIEEGQDTSDQYRPMQKAADRIIDFYKLGDLEMQFLTIGAEESGKDEPHMFFLAQSMTAAPVAA